MNRIYLVRNTDTGTESLVRAPNRAQALRHIVKTTYTVDLASQDQLVELISNRQEIEEAGSDFEVEDDPAEFLPAPEPRT